MVPPSKVRRTSHRTHAPARQTPKHHPTASWRQIRPTTPAKPMAIYERSSQQPSSNTPGQENPPESGQHKTTAGTRPAAVEAVAIEGARPLRPERERERETRQRR